VSAEAVGAAVKIARLSQKMRRREAQVEKKVVAVAVEQTEKAAPKATPSRDKNDTVVKRLSLADLRAAARRRQVGV
jgi:hypothetical protein